MHRYFITGTDTDVGKTRVAASVALALAAAYPTTVVKAVQTGLEPGVPGDAQLAGSLAGVAYRELARFRKPADPWSAALAEDAAELHAEDLVKQLAAIEGALVVEGAGGLMVPLNEREHFGHLAKRAGLEIVVAIGLRLGCINHAMLTLALCEHQGLTVAGAVLVERWEPVSDDYAQDVMRALQGNVKIFGIVPFAAEEQASVRAAARLFSDLVT